MTKSLLSRTLAANASAHPQDVRSIKTILQSLGYYQAPDWGIDEFPDRAMFDALRAFQKDHGLKVDGVMKPDGESASTLKAAAQMVRAQGRNGDTVLAHITPTEAALLDKVTDGGSINPATGLPEFFIGDMFGEFGSGFTSLGDGLRKALPHLSEDFATMGPRSTRQKAGGLVGDALGPAVTDALGTLAKKSPSNPLGPRMSPSLGIGLETRSGKPANPAHVQNEYVISESESTDRTNTQRAAPMPESTWGVPPVTPKVKPKIAPATPPFQNPDRMRQWVKESQAQWRLQPQQKTVPSLSADVHAANARMAEALSKTGDFSAVIPHLDTALKSGGSQGQAEVQNLIEHMDQRIPGHGQKLATELGTNTQQLKGEATYTHRIENMQAMSKVPQIAGIVIKGAAKWFKNRKRRMFEKDTSKRYRKDNAGNQFVQDIHGNVDLGNPFNDIAEDELQKTGLKRLSVRLERGQHYVKSDGRPGGHGDVHITPQHEQQILDMVDENGNPLFSDVADYVDFVSNHWTEVRQGKDGSPILVVRDPSIVNSAGKQNVMILELKKMPSTDFYSPKTAAPMVNRYLSKFKVLLERGAE